MQETTDNSIPLTPFIIVMNGVYFFVFNIVSIKTVYNLNGSKQQNKLEDCKMYIVKNALRSIARSKGRNILIGIIVLVIALSSCIGLSIREAANKAKESAMEDLSVTAQISIDRSSMMKDMQKP